MSKALSYAEATRLLGHRDSKLVDSLDRIAGGVILAGSLKFPVLLSLLGPKSEFVRLSHKLVHTISEQRVGVNRYNRTQRLEAAHAVLVLAAFFEAFDEVPLPFRFTDLEVSTAEQITLAHHAPVTQEAATTMVQSLLDAPIPLPAAYRSYEATVELLSTFFGDRSEQFADFIHGLHLWDALDDTERERYDKVLKQDLPQHAVRRYEELFRQLATEFPEIGFWSSLQDSQATRAEIRAVGTALAEMGHILAAIASGSAPDKRRAELARKYRSSLDRPIINPDDVPDGLQIPLLRNAYIDPRFRVAEAESSSAVSGESWWERTPVRQDMHAFLTGYLTAPQAAQAPLLVLGQPGSGKSMLTRVLAARLPPNDFLTVRVELRSTPTEADLLGQVEYALRDALKEDVSWATLARSAGDTLPVILLDGFDELLQATGVSQTNYLTKIAEFQRDRIEVGHPVAVVVTSRTSVADRARIPQDTVAVRLEPFDEEQVAAWLAGWNTINTDYFTAHDLLPLSPEAVRAYPALAEQPLLLLMLALYDADGNALQLGSVSLGHAQLYERLLTRFARREVTKDGDDRAETAIHKDMEGELHRLSVVAFAMFNRHSQWVTEPDLDQDLAALLGTGHPSAGRPGMRTPLGAGEAVLGQFFFVQRSQARRDDSTLRTYEFLHATFGEFLVARFTWHVLRDMVARESSTANTLLGDRLDDGLLHAVLSFAPLTDRAPTIDFLAEMAGAATPEQRAGFAELVTRLFRGSLDAHPERTHTDYQPVLLPVPARHAIYSTNLVLLSTIVCGEVRASELFEQGVSVVDEWNSLALLWQSQLAEQGWDALIRAVMLQRVWDQGQRDIVLTISNNAWRPADTDTTWIFNWGETRGRELSAVASDSWKLSEWRREAHFVCGMRGDMLSHAVESLDYLLADAFHILMAEGDEEPASPAHLLLSILAAPADQTNTDRRVNLYRRTIKSLLQFPSFPSGQEHHWGRLILDRLSADITTKTFTIDALDTELIGQITGRVHVASWLCQQLGRDPANDGHLWHLISSVGGFNQVVDSEPDIALDACLRLRERGEPPDPDLQLDLVEMLGRLDLESLTRTRPDLITRARRELREQNIPWPPPAHQR